MTEYFVDSRNEYLRKCPYCFSTFTATHLNRQYCPSKNGILNFCKNRQKRLLKQIKENGVVRNMPQRNPTKIIFESLPKNYRNIDELILVAELERKTEILEKLLQGTNEKIVSIMELLRLNFTIEEFDLHTKNSIGQFTYIYGCIQLQFETDEKIKIKRMDEN